MRTYQVTNLTAAAGMIAIDAAEEVAVAKGIRLSTAVVDSAGNLIAFRRMDGATLVTIASAQSKARAAATVGQPTGKFQDLLNGGATMLLAVEGLFPVQGGVPVILDGVTVGGIGCGGASGKDDEFAAQAGAAALTVHSDETP